MVLFAPTKINVRLLYFNTSNEDTIRLLNNILDYSNLDKQDIEKIKTILSKYIN